MWRDRATGNATVGSAVRCLGDVPDVLPARGVPGGWRDWWDGPDPAVAAREHRSAKRLPSDPRPGILPPGSGDQDIDVDEV